MPKYLDIFWSFFKVGAFTVGGGYAMIPLMQKEMVERHRWLTDEEFLDQVALSQAMPGVFAVNMATVVGQRLRGFILLLATVFRAFRDNPYVNHIFLGIRPAVVALIAAPVFTLARSAKVTWSNCWIPVVSALLIWLLGVNPVLVILAAAVGGIIYGKIKTLNS